MNTLLPFPALALALAIASPAAAQNFNVDLGGSNPSFTPSSAYGAAAAQPGVWNGISSANGAIHSLLDVSGAATAVSLSHVGGFGDFAVNNPNWSGDDANLMEDAYDVASGSITFTFTGLQAGNYEVYTYALAPDDDTFRTRVTVTGGAPGPVNVGGVWTSSPHVVLISYAKHTVNIAVSTDLTVVCSNPGSPAGNLATANGFQLKYLGGGGGGPLGTQFCFGDGTGTGCPCGNNSSFGGNAGCLNSLGTAGTLTAAGTASLSNDTAVLSGAGMVNSSALYFQGTAQQSGGLGSVLGDGLRCAAGTVVRLSIKMNSSFSSSYPMPGDQPISVKGQLLGAGTRTYQVWYRNANLTFCTAATYNLTNGIEITWVP